MTKATRRTLSFGTSMGISSIIAILVILVLVVFSALAITTSKADLSLSRRTSDSITASYEADAAAEDKVAEIAVLITKGSGWQSDARSAGFEISDGENGSTLISYNVPVDRFRNLSIVLHASIDGTLSREIWQIVPANAWIPDESIDVIMP